MSDIACGKLSDFLDDKGEVDPAKIANAGYSLEAYDYISGDRDSQCKVKIRNPIQAIERLSKLLGWDEPEKVDHGGVIFNLNLTGNVT